MDKSRLAKEDFIGIKHQKGEDYKDYIQNSHMVDWVKQWNEKVLQEDKEKMAKQIFDSLVGIKPEPKIEPELDYEPIQVDRRKDLDYIEKLSGDHQLLVITLAELVAQGKADFLFIEHTEIQEFWHRHCIKLGQLRAKEAEQKRIKELKESALKKLTPDEKKALGIK
jgi:hypothetical protein